MSLPINKSTAQPVSRFWACFFSSGFILNGLVGLLWTQTMKKTRKYAVLCSMYFIGVFSVTFVIVALFETLSISDEIISLISIILIFLIICSIIAPTYFMFKWTTQYNIDKFGYKSKKEWQSHN